MEKKKLVKGTALALLSTGGVAGLIAIAVTEAPGSSKPILKVDPGSREEHKIEYETIVQKPGSDKDDKEKNGRSYEDLLNSDANRLFNGDNDQRTEKQISKKLVLANDKINYIALGDSIAAGFDGSLDKDYQGQKEESGAISGVGYPAFLARLLNGDNNRVTDFKNYAVSGSRILDWINLLGINYGTQDASQVTTQLSQYFGKDYQSVAEDLKARLKNANLVTISLGGNDLFSLVFESLKSLNLSSLVESLLGDNPTYSDVIGAVNNLYKAIVPEIKKRYVILLANLRVLAPKANINIIGYTMPFLRLKKTIDSILGNFSGMNISVSDTLLSYINGLLKSLAQPNNDIYYVDTWNSDFYSQNARLLSDTFLDIHGNINSYKRMAMDIYLKLTTADTNLSSYGNSSYDFTEKFIKSDLTTLNYQIQVNNKNLNSIFGANSLAYLNNKGIYELQALSKRNVGNYPNRIFEIGRQLNYVFIDFLTSLIYTNKAGSSSKENADLIKLLMQKDEFGNYKIASLIESIARSNGVQNILNNIQNELDELDKQNKLDLNSLIRVLLKSVSRESDVVSLVKAVVSSDFVDQNSDELSQKIGAWLTAFARDFKGLAINIATNFVARSQVGDFVSVEDLKLLIEQFFDSPSFNSLLKNVVSAVFTNKALFKDAQTYDDLARAIFGNKEINQKIANDLYELLKATLNNSSFSKLVSEFVFKFLQSQKLDNNLTQEKVTKLVADLLKWTNSYNKLNDLLKGVVATYLDSVATKGLNTSLEAVSNLALTSLRKEFNSVEESITGVVNSLAESNLVTENKETLKTLVANLVNGLNNVSLNKLLSLFLKDEGKLNSFLTNKDLKNLFSVVADNDQSKKILVQVVSDLIDNFDKFKNAKTTDDLFKAVLGSLNLDKLQEESKDFISNLLKNPNFQSSVSGLLSNALGSTLAEDPKVKTLLDSLVKNLPTLLEGINLDEKFLKTTFDVLKEAKQSNWGLEQTWNKLLENANSQVTKVLEGNLSNLVTKLLTDSEISKDKDSLNKVIFGLYKNLKDSDSLTNLIVSQVENLSKTTPLLNGLSKEALEKVVTLILNSPQTDSLVKKVIESLTKDTEWTSLLDNPLKLVEHLLKDKDFVTALKDPSLELLKTLVTNSNFNSLASTLLTNLLTQYGVTLDPVKLNSLSLSLTNDLFPFLKDSGILDKATKFFFDDLAKTQNLLKTVNNLTSNLASLVDFSDYSVFKSLVKSDFFKNQKSTIKDIAKQVATSLLANEDFVKNNLLSLDVVKKLTTSFGLLDDAALKLLKAIFDTPSFKETTNLLLDKVFDSLDKIDSTNSYLDLLKLVFGDDDFNTKFVTAFKKALVDFSQDPQFKTQVASVLTSIVSSDSKLSTLLDKITDKEGFLSSLVGLVKPLDENLDLVSSTLNLVLAKLKNASSLNLNMLTSEVLSNLKSLLDLGSQEKVVNLLKAVLNDPEVQKQKDNYVQFVKNAAKFALNNLDVTNLVWDSLPQGLKNALTSAFVSEGTLKDALEKVLKNEAVVDLVANATKYFLDNPTSLSDAKTYVDVLKTYLKNNKNTLKADLSKLVNVSLNSTEVKKAVNEFLWNLLNKNNLTNGITKEQLEKLTNDVLAWSGSYSKFETLFDSLVDGFVNGYFTGAGSSVDLVSLVTNSLSTSFGNLPDFAAEVLSSLAGSSALTENKDVLKKLLSNVADNLSTFNLESLLSTLVKNTPVNDFVSNSDLNKLLNIVLSTEQSKTLLKSLLGSVVDNLDSLKGATSANDLFTKLLKVVDFNTLKTQSENFFSNLLSDTKMQDALFDLVKGFLKPAKLENYKDALKALRVLVKQLPELVKHFSLDKEFIDLAFNTLKNAKDKNLNLDQTWAELSKKLSEKVNSLLGTKFKDIAKWLLNNAEVNKNKTGLNNLLYGLFTFAKDKNLLNSLLLSQLEKLKQSNPLFNNVSSSALSGALTTLLNSSEFNVALKSALALLTKDSSWVDKLDKPLDLINHFVSDDKFVNILKTQSLNLVKTLLSNANFKSVLSQILTNLLKQYKLNLNASKVKALVDSLSTDLYAFLQSNWILEKVNTFFFTDLAKTKNLLTTLNNLTSQFSSFFDLTDYNLFKKLVTSKFFKSQKETLKDLVKQASTTLLKDANFVKTNLLNFEPVKNLVSSLGLSNDSAAKVLNLVVSDSKFAEATKLLIDRVFTSLGQVDKTKSYLDLLKEVFNDSTFKTNFVSKFKDALLSLTQNSDFKSEVSKVVLSIINKDPKLSTLLNNVTNKEQFLSSVIGLLKPLDQNLNLVSNVVNLLLGKLSNPQKLNLNSILASVTNDLKSVVDLSNEKTLINLLKTVLKDSEVKKQRNNYVQFVKNAVDYAVKNLNLPELVWNNLPQNAKNLLNREFVSEKEFKDLLSAVLRNNSTATLVTNFATYFLNNPNSLDNANSLVDVLKTYLKAQNSKFKTDLNNLVKSSLNLTEFKNAVNDVLWKLLTKHQLTTNLTKEKVGKLSGDLLAWAGSYDKVGEILNSAINKFLDLYANDKNNNKNWDIWHLVNNAVTSKFGNVTSFATDALSSFAKSNAVENNKDTLKTLFTNVIDKLESFDYNALLNVLLKDNPVNKFVSSSDLNTLLKAVFSNGAAKELLKKLANNLVDNFKEFKNVKNLNDLLTSLLKALDFNQLKVNAHTLFNSLLGNEKVQNALVNVAKNFLAPAKLNSDTKVINHLKVIIGELPRLLTKFRLNVDVAVKSLENSKNKKTTLDQTWNSMLSDASVQVEVMFKTQFKPLIKWVLNNKEISKDKKSLSKLVYGIYVFAKDNHVLNNAISSQVDNLTKNLDLLKNVSKDSLVKMLNTLLNNSDFDSIVKSAFDVLTKDSSWVDLLDNPVKLFNYFVKDSTFLTKLKTPALNLVKTLVSDNNLKAVLKVVLNNFLNKYGVKVEQNKVDKLVDSLAKDFYPFIESNGILTKVTDFFFKDLQTTKNVLTTFNNLSSKLVELVNLNDYTVFKNFISSNFFASQKDTIKDIVKKLITNLSNNPEFIKSSLLNFGFVKQLVSQFKLSQDTLATTLQLALKNENMQKVVNTLVDRVFAATDSIKSTSSYNDLLKLIFNDKSVNATLVKDIKEALLGLTQDSSFRDLLSNLLVSYVDNDPKLKPLFEGINDKKGLVGALLSVLKPIDKQLNLISPFLNKSLEELSKASAQTDLNKVVQVSLTALQNVFSKDNETKVVNLLKTLINERELFLNRIQFSTLMKNMIKQMQSTFDLGTMLWNGLDSNLRNQVQDKALDQGAFVKFVNIVFQNVKLGDQADRIFNYVFNTRKNNPLKDVTTYFGVFKKYVKDNQHALVNDLQYFILDAVKNPKVQGALNDALWSVLTKWGINKSKALTDAILKTTSNLSSFLESTQIPVLLGKMIRDAVLKSSNFTEVANQVNATMKDYLPFNDFSFVAKILKNATFSNNKALYKNAVNDLLQQILRSRDSVKRIATKLNVARILGFKDETRVNELVAGALSDSHVRNLATTFSNYILDRITDFSNANSFGEAINKLFRENSQVSNYVKNEIIAWVRDLMTSKDKTIYDGIAAILVQKLNENRWKLRNSDIPVISNFVQGFLAGVAKNSPNNDYASRIIDSVYQAVKNVDYTKSENIMQTMTSSLKEGLVALFLTSDKKSISLNSILRKKDWVQTIISSIGNQNYVAFINLLFDRSDSRRNTGIFPELRRILTPEEYASPHQGGSNSGGGAAAQGYGLSLDTNLIWAVSQGFKEFIGTFFIPMWEGLFNDYIKLSYNARKSFDYKNNANYKAMFRLSTLFLWFLRTQPGISNYMYWSYANAFTVSNFVAYGLWWAQDEVLKRKYSNGRSYRDNILRSRPSDRQLKTIGMEYWYNHARYHWYYIFGYTENVNIYNYRPSQMLAYVYYENKKRFDRNWRSFKVSYILYLALELGRMPENANDFKLKNW